jgi:sporulation protein YlmC with PRC-barrel domain
MHNSNVWLATALLSDRVRNSAGEDLGKIEDVAIDPQTGTIQYAVLSFGGVLGVGNKLFPIPWSALSISPSRDYLLVDIDKESLRRAPSFERNDWPNMADPVWRRNINDHYGNYVPVRPAAVVTPVVKERVYVEPRKPARRMSLAASILLLCLVLGIGWVTYLVATRGWDQAKEDMRSSVESAAYAAKETSQDAALTTKVKTALSLSKRIPAGNINVDTANDVVTLRGEVPSEEIRSLAESITREVPGVSEVHNHLYAPSGSR